MRRETKQTLLYAALLGIAAAAAPFVSLLPIFPPGKAVDGTVQSTPAPSPTASPRPSGQATPTPAPQQEAAPLLLYDKDSESVLEVSAVEYLIGTAACEMPADWPDEALRAQMVASHSYALYAAAHGGGTDGACLDVNRAQCSGWTDAEVLRSRWGDTYEETYARFKALAESVENDLMLYDGEPAATCYHAVSCGHTEASQNIWSEALPYLQGVDSAWDKYSDDYEVTVQYTQQQVAAALESGLGLTPDGEPGSWLGATVWDTAGYVQQVTLCGQRFSGVQLRNALNLRSACFAIAWRGGSFVITTRGYGHGVGLSQYGAYSMAQGGADWKEILCYYFPGAVAGTIAD